MRRRPVQRLPSKGKSRDNTAPRPRRSLERSVDSLERIFAFIVALAVTDAIRVTFLGGSQNPTLRWPTATVFAAFLAFLVTIVPFYHGMNRHLEECYIRREPRAEGALLFDFVFFFVEASLLFAITASLRDPNLGSFFFLGILLFIDVVWATISNRIHYGQKAHGITTWTTVNLTMITVGAAIYFVAAKGAALSAEWQASLLLVVAVLRSVLDYYFTWDFYFPKDAQA